jgi:hypothetical protein
LLASDQQERVQQMRIAFFAKLSHFRKLQAVYMPAAVRVLQEEEDARDPDLPPPKAEDVKLYLPSGIRAADRASGCRKGLPEMEAKLWEGQCGDALRKLRTRLHAKKHLLVHRDTNVVGQRAATHAYTLIERIGDRVNAMAAKYRRAREALLALRGEGECEKWKELKETDIQLDEEHEVDTPTYRKLGSIGSSKGRRHRQAVSSKKKMLSWIWTADGGPGEDEAEVHECK